MRTFLLFGSASVCPVRTREDVQVLHLPRTWQHLLLADEELHSIQDTSRLHQGRWKDAEEMNKKYLAGAFFLCTVTLPSYAANWVLISINLDGDTFFVDKSSLQRDGDSVTFWRRTNYKERDTDGDLSSRIQTTINCHILGTLRATSLRLLHSN